MIPESNIISWRNSNPWPSYDQVEHDLVLSRIICELYQNHNIRNNLVFRGGTALHKLFFNIAGRFSEDLDFVQTEAKPIGKTVNEIRSCLDHWLGKPSWKQNHGRFTLIYKFETEIEPVIQRKVKIEINTREHKNTDPYEKKQFYVNNNWFQNQAIVLTYSIEELLATKLRALYQRKKGRDLYDFWYATLHIPNLNIEKIIKIFYCYMMDEGTKISRAEFEKNLSIKKKSIVFNGDITPLLSHDYVSKYNIEEAYELIFSKFMPHLIGDSWKNLQPCQY